MCSISSRSTLFGLLTVTLSISVESYNPNNHAVFQPQSPHYTTVQNYRNFEPLRNPHPHHLIAHQNVHHGHYNHNLKYPPQAYGNFQTFAMPNNQHSYSIPMSMSMSASASGGSMNSPNFYYPHPPSTSPSYLNPNHRIRLLQPLPRILNSPSTAGHENVDATSASGLAGTKYLELNLSNNAGDDFKGSLQVSQYNNNKGHFSPSLSYGSRAARRGIVENDQDNAQLKLPFLTSTFYKTKSINNKNERRIPSKKGEIEKDENSFKEAGVKEIKKNGFVASPQVKVFSLGNDGGNDGIENRVQENDFHRDDGWVGLDGVGSFSTIRVVTESPISFTTNEASTTNAATITTKRMKIIKPIIVMERNSSKDLVSPSMKTLVRDSLKINKVPTFEYKMTKLTKTKSGGISNITSKIARNDKKPDKGLKYGYAKVSNGTIRAKTSGNLTKIANNSIVNISLPANNLHNENITNSTNKPHFLIPGKTVSASKMPGVPTTDLERGHPLVRNSRKPEMSTSTESLVHNNRHEATSATNIHSSSYPMSTPKSSNLHIVEATSNSFVHQHQNAKSQQKFHDPLPPTILQASSGKFQEPNPSPEQIMQFTPNDVRSDFQIGSQPQIPSQSQNLYFITPKSSPHPSAASFSQQIPHHGHSQTPASLFATSIPILNNVNSMRNVNVNVPYQRIYPNPHPSPNLGRMAHSKNLPHFHPHRQPRHDLDHTKRRMLMPTPSSGPNLRSRQRSRPQNRPRRMTTLPHQAPSQPTDFSSRSLDTGTGLGSGRNRGKDSDRHGSSSNIVKKSSASVGSSDKWLPFNFGRSGHEDDSEEELFHGGFGEHDGIPIVDPQHPVVQNALNPLGNPAREPDQLIKKHTKILDPSSLIPLDKKLVIIVIMVGWLVMFAALFSYKAWGKKGARMGLEDQQDEFGFSKPLLLNIPKDGTDPYIGTSRAMDVSGPNWSLNFVKVLDYIDIARKNYEGFDWQNLDCQKRVLCELSQGSPTGETGRKITNNYLLRFVDVLDGLPIPQVIQAYLTEYKDAITQGKNTKKTCGEIYSKCKFSLTKLMEKTKHE